MADSMDEGLRAAVSAALLAMSAVDAGGGQQGFENAVLIGLDERLSHYAQHFNGDSTRAAAALWLEALMALAVVLRAGAEIRGLEVGAFAAELLSELTEES